MEKYCPKCKQKKQLNMFNKNKARYDGLSSWCRKCFSDYEITHKKEKSKRGIVYYNNHKQEKSIYGIVHKEGRAYRNLKRVHPKLIWPKSIIDRKSAETILRHLLHEVQRDKCYVCGKPANGESLALDHDHYTNMLRGWVHIHCNVGLLMWLDYEYQNYPEDREKILSNPDYRRILLNPPASYLYAPLDKSIVV